MTQELDSRLKRLHLANARRAWRQLVQRAEQEEWTHEALLRTLFDEEVAHRRGTRLARAVRAAAFPFLRTIEEFDFSFQSTLRITTIGSLLAPDFITEGGAVILEGKPGRGKTHLAVAIAYRALQNGFDALFTTAADLIGDIRASVPNSPKASTISQRISESSSNSVSAGTTLVAGPILPRAVTAFGRMYSPWSLSNQTIAVVASSAAGPMFPKASIASARTSGRSSFSNSTSAEHTDTASGPISFKDSIAA